MVKEQITAAQITCYSLIQRNKLKRSTSRTNTIKKLKGKIRWLKSYFLDSFLSSCPDGRRSRILIVTHYKTLRVPRRIRQPRRNAYLKKRKKGEVREVNKGPTSATKTPGNTKMHPQIENSFPSEIDNKSYVTQMIEAPSTEPRLVDNEPRQGHAYDMIKGLLERATRLAGTDTSTQDHQTELHAIKEDTRCIEEFLNVLRNEALIPTGRGPKIHNHQYYSRFIPRSCNLSTQQTRLLLGVTEALDNDVLAIAGQVREYAAAAAGTEDVFAYSQNIAIHLARLTGPQFPEAQAKIYTKTILNATLENTPTGQDCTVILQDHGAELYHYAIRDEGADSPFNLHPLGTILTHMLTASVNREFLIGYEEKRELIGKLLTEPARCFFIALGKATNINPIILQNAFRMEAQQAVGLNPDMLRLGSLSRDPMLSLLMYGEYVDHSVLHTIFPDCIADYRVVVYTCSWRHNAENVVLNVLTAASYQADNEPKTRVATIFLQTNYHYTNIIDNTDLAHVPVLMAIPPEHPDKALRTLRFHSANRRNSMHNPYARHTP